MSPEELARALSGTIAGQPPVGGHDITVTDVEFRALGDGSCLFEALVTVQIADGPVELWDWHLTLTPVELNMPNGTLVATIRANIEEWWHVKDREPEAAALGRRRS
jgi:hypothetical protein